MINLDDLEAKARRAIEARGLNVGMADVRMSHAALNLVSTCSPESVLALVAELRALRAVADAARSVRVLARAYPPSPNTVDYDRDLEAEAARAFRETASSSDPHGVIASALRIARAEGRRAGLEAATAMREALVAVLAHADKTQHCGMCNRGEMNPSSHTIECPLFAIRALAKVSP